MGRKAIFAIAAFGIFFVFLMYRLFSPSVHICERQPKNDQVVEITETWNEFHPQSELFTVSLPSVPQHAAEIIHAPDGEGQIRYDMYISHSRKNITYVINIIDYPATYDVSNTESFLQGIMNELLGGNPSNKLLSDSQGTFLGCPSLDFSIQNKTALLKAKVFMRDRTIFVLSVASPTEEMTNEALNKLASTFSLSNNPHTTPSTGT